MALKKASGRIPAFLTPMRLRAMAEQAYRLWLTYGTNKTTQTVNGVQYTFDIHPEQDMNCVFIDFASEYGKHVSVQPIRKCWSY